MIFYLTTYINPKDPDGPGVERFDWSTTQEEAKNVRVRLKIAGYEHIDTKQVDIPTDKAHLLAWLQENLLGKDLAGLLIPPKK